MQEKKMAIRVECDVDIRIHLRFSLRECELNIEHKESPKKVNRKVNAHIIAQFEKSEPPACVDFKVNICVIQSDMQKKEEKKICAIIFRI